MVAPLWVAYDANLGTLLRTCDAIGACMAVPDSQHYRDALRRGDTLRRGRPCIHWVRGGKDAWVAEQRAAGAVIVAVELAEGSVRGLQISRPAGFRMVAARIFKRDPAGPGLRRRPTHPKRVCRWACCRCPAKFSAGPGTKPGPHEVEPSRRKIRERAFDNSKGAGAD